jgi:hypothetical protein
LPADLVHPRAVGLAHDPGDMNPARSYVDGEEDAVADQAGEREDIDIEAAHRGGRAPMGLDERVPRHWFAALGSGLEAVQAADALDRVATDDMAEIAERIAQPGIALARILLGELDH